jgi:hypothetical protein
VDFNCLVAIEAACKRLGWRLCKGQKTYNWVGRWYDDSPVPRNLFDKEEDYKRVCAMSREERTREMQKRLGHCTHAIQVPGATGEIGLIEREGKFVPIWDYYAYGLGEVRENNGMAGFVQAYAVERAKLEANLRGEFCTEQQHEGTIKLRINIPEF